MIVNEFACNRKPQGLTITTGQLIVKDFALPMDGQGGGRGNLIVVDENRQRSMSI